MIKRFNDFTIEKNEYQIDLDIDNKDDKFIDELIDKLSFVYKKRKDRHVRPISIKGKTLKDDIKLDIVLSNKDKLQLKYKNNDDLRIKINGDVVYHMDKIKDDIIGKIYKKYTKYLKDSNFKISKKDNPFESLDLSLFEHDMNPVYSNCATLKRTNQMFIVGAIDLKTGYIYEVYTKEEIDNENWEINNISSPEILTKISNGEVDIFWFDENLELEYYFGQGSDQDSFLISELKKQISITNPFNNIYNNSPKMVYEKMLKNKKHK